MNVREEIVEVCRRMVADGLVTGTAGNVSVRLDDGAVLATPSGVLYHRLSARDLPVVDPATGDWEGPQRPTSEVPLHLGLLLARPDVKAVVHTHSPYAAAHAVVGLDIPFICNENLANHAEKVLVTRRYAPPGTDGLAAAALATFDEQPGSRAVLLANHGVVAIAGDLETAYTVAAQVEWLARVHHLARALGDVRTIDRADQQTMAANYGVSLTYPEERS